MRDGAKTWESMPKLREVLKKLANIKKVCKSSQKFWCEVQRGCGEGGVIFWCAIVHFLACFCACFLLSFLGRLWRPAFLVPFWHDFLTWFLACFFGLFFAVLFWCAIQNSDASFMVCVCRCVKVSLRTAGCCQKRARKVIILLKKSTPKIHFNWILEIVIRNIFLSSTLLKKYVQNISYHWKNQYKKQNCSQTRLFPGTDHFSYTIFFPASCFRFAFVIPLLWPSGSISPTC